MRPIQIERPQKNIFTSEKLYKSDELVDAIKILKINDAKCYESKTATASNSQGDLTRNTKTVPHTRNGNFEQRVSSYRTIPVLHLLTNTGIDQGVALSILAPQMLLKPVTKEVVADAASGGAWIYMNP